MKLVSVEQMRAIEAEADRAGLSYAEMMQRAGSGVAEVVQDLFEGQGGLVLGLVGGGNNGGDALVALAELARQGWEAHAYLARPREENDPLVTVLREAGGQVWPRGNDARHSQLRDLLSRAEVLLDGVLGTGFQLPLKPEIGAILRTVQQQSPNPLVVAIDCPSGVDSDSGQAAPETIRADVTACMQAIKAGLLRLPAFELCGNLTIIDLGLPGGLESMAQVDLNAITFDDVRTLLPERPGDAHKGTFGTALIVAGSLNYTGAALLAAEAAYRSGAGLVQAAVPAPLHTALAGVLPEATWLLLPHELGVISARAAEVVRENLWRATAMLLGCGWGGEDITTEFLQRLLNAATPQARPGLGFMPASGSAAETYPGLPAMVIDADGLRHLSKIKDWPRYLPAGSVLTPHPGEMSTLTGLSVDEIQRDRTATAARFADQWQQTVVLKGAFTVIADSGGESWVLPVASAALARAGTGDVLAGLIAGLMAQGLSGTKAARLGVWIHGQAGLMAEDRLGSSASVLAGDVLRAVPAVMAGLI